MQADPKVLTWITLQCSTWFYLNYNSQSTRIHTCFKNDWFTSFLGRRDKYDKAALYLFGWLGRGIVRSIWNYRCDQLYDDLLSAEVSMGPRTLCIDVLGIGILHDFLTDRKSKTSQSSFLTHTIYVFHFIDGRPAHRNKLWWLAVWSEGLSHFYTFWPCSPNVVTSSDPCHRMTLINTWWPLTLSICSMLLLVSPPHGDIFSWCCTYTF